MHPTCTLKPLFTLDPSIVSWEYIKHHKYKYNKKESVIKLKVVTGWKKKQFLKAKPNCIFTFKCMNTSTTEDPNKQHVFHNTATQELETKWVKAGIHSTKYFNSQHIKALYILVFKKKKKRENVKTSGHDNWYA